MKRALLFLLCCASIVHTEVAASSHVPILVDVSGIGEWREFWWGLSSPIREQYTEAPSARLKLAYTTVLARAYDFDFRFKKPKLLQTTATSSTHIQPPGDVYYGGYFHDENLIVIDGPLSQDMSDEELEVLVAHELGHALDLQSHRIGHHALVAGREFREQQFADYIAMLLTQIGSVKRFNRKYIYSVTVKSATS